MEYSDVNNLMNLPSLRNGIVFGLTKIVKSIDLDENYGYRKGLCEYNNEIGHLDLKFGSWEWSWLEAVNSNLSCIGHLISEYNYKNSNKLTYNYFITQTQEGLSSFLIFLENNKKEIFNPENNIFNKMKFDSQFSWNKGKISEFSTLYSINQNYPKIDKIKLDFRRGLKDDRKGGNDFEIEYNNKIRKCQNKFAYNSLKYMDGDYWVFNKIYYHDKLYEGVDDLFIDDSFNIYHFKNSRDRSLCGMFKDKDNKNVFKIHDSLKVKKMKKDNTEVTDLLIELNKFTHDRQIEFHFVKDESGDNSFSLVKENGIDKVKFVLNDFEDKELQNKILDFYNELKNVFK